MRLTRTGDREQLRRERAAEVSPPLTCGQVRPSALMLTVSVDTAAAAGVNLHTLTRLRLQIHGVYSTKQMSNLRGRDYDNSEAVCVTALRFPMTSFSAI